MNPPKKPTGNLDDSDSFDDDPRSEQQDEDLSADEKFDTEEDDLDVDLEEIEGFDEYNEFDDDDDF